MKLVQIGSHKGYDDFTELLRKFSPNTIDFLLLVEPNFDFNESLLGCYNEYNPIIENIVVSTDCENNKTKFYTCDKSIYPDSVGSNYSELSSIYYSHLIKHGIREDGIIEKKIDCYNINELFEKYKIDSLDILFVDVEGFDYELIKSIDFTKFDIKKIYYENLHIDNTQMISFLEQKGYKINNNIFLNGWTSEAFKN